MFDGWLFLLTEIWILLVLAGLLGLFCGWIIWGFGKSRRAFDPVDGAVAGKTLPPLEVEAMPGVAALPPGVNIDAPPDDLRRIRGIGAKLRRSVISLASIPMRKLPLGRLMILHILMHSCEDSRAGPAGTIGWLRPKP